VPAACLFLFKILVDLPAGPTVANDHRNVHGNSANDNHSPATFASSPSPFSRSYKKVQKFDKQKSNCWWTMKRTEKRAKLLLKERMRKQNKKRNERQKQKCTEHSVASK